MRYPHLSRTARIFLLISVFAMTYACTQKRPERFVQGQGINLDAVSTWSQRVTSVRTGEVIGKSPTTQAQDSVKVDTRLKSLNHYDLVELIIEDESLKTLIGAPPFRGKPNQGRGTYEIHSALTESYLKFYKVALPENLPFEEHFYKETLPGLNDGRIAIPMVSYKVKGYFTIEKQKTGDDQDTHQRVEVAQPTLPGSTHVRIDWNSRETFLPVKTADLLPISLFFNTQLKPYEWYFSETVTEKTITDESTIVGESAQRVENSKLNPATKVIFVPREKELRVVNVARDERLDRNQIEQSADLNNEAALLLPVEWRQIRTQDAGKTPGMKGEIVEEVKWSNRNFIEANFVKVESAGLLNAGRRGNSKQDIGTNRLIDLEIGKNYFSFTLMNMSGSTGKKIHYSFLRADQDRTPYPLRRFFKADQKLFGYFSTKKPYFANWEYYTEEDMNRRVLLNRMNPNQSEIVFHMSHESSKAPDLETATIAAIEAWDRGFQKALEGTGRNIRVRYSKDRVRLGDLRYNVIHLVDTIAEDGLLGFGPSVADPVTGEIISASSNIYVNSFQAIAANAIRQYLINRVEGRLSRALVDPASLAPASMAQSHSTLHEALTQPFKIEKFQEQLKTNSPLSLAQKTHGPTCEHAQTIAATTGDKEIYEQCPELELLLARFKDKTADFQSRATGAATWEAFWAASREGDDALKLCSRRITSKKLISTLIHEIGHNLGLRHNFLGSVDKNNFPTLKLPNGKSFQPKSSSIMEYTVFEEDRLTEAGPYDVAAIRYGYGDTVDLSNGESVKLSTQVTVVDELATRKKSLKELKPYLFCTDEEAYTSFNALCRPHDFGTTPAEIADYYISLYDRLQELRRYRRVRPWIMSEQRLGNDLAGRIFIPLKEIYDQWRYALRDYVGASKAYLPDIQTNDQYKALIQGMAKDPHSGKIAQDYYPTVQKIYQFFFNVAFSLNHYCLVQNEAVEFESLRNRIIEKTRGQVRIRSCAEAVGAAGGFDQKAQVQEVGYPLKSYRYEAAENLEESLTQDVVGNEVARMYAGLMISFRNPNNRNLINQYLPSMTDELPFYLNTGISLVNRSLQGVSLKPQISSSALYFSEESDLFSNLTAIFRSNLALPNPRATNVDLEASMRRLAPFSTIQVQPGEKPEKGSAVLVMNGRPTYFAPSSGYFLADRLIRRYNEIDPLLQVTPYATDRVNLAPGILNQILPPKAKLKDLTLGHLLMMFEGIFGGQNEQGQTTEGLMQYLPGLWECLQTKKSELKQLNDLIDPLGELLKSVQDEEALKKVLATPLEPWAEKALGQSIRFDADTVGDLKTSIDACVNENQKRVDWVEKNAYELKAQKSLILRILQATAS